MICVFHVNPLMYPDHMKLPEGSCFIQHPRSSRYACARYHKTSKKPMLSNQPNIAYTCAKISSMGTWLRNYVTIIVWVVISVHALDS